MTSSGITREKRAGSRSRIVDILLKGQRTVEELAQTLGVTDNAIRAQISLLEKDGLVEAQGEVKGTRRPAALYGIRAGADVQFSRAYPLFLSHLVKIMGKRMQPKQLETVMQNVGQSIADSVQLPIGDPRQRVQEAVKFLSSLGSLAELHDEGGKLVIQGHGCPISRAVEADVRSCAAMQTLLSRITGLSVAEKCHHGAHPSCRFEIKLPTGK